jgi:hypothetical protein
MEKSSSACHNDRIEKENKKNCWDPLTFSTVGGDFQFGGAAPPRI